MPFGIPAEDFRGGFGLPDTREPEPSVSPRIEMIPTEQRQKYHCYYCGATASVKYICRIDGLVIPVCNRCVATVIFAHSKKAQ